MLLDARKSETVLDRAADFAIIGGGVAGIVLARRLARRHSVILIESGGLDPDPATQSLYEGEVTGLRYSLNGSRMRLLGGSSNHWGGWCSPMDPEDFDAQPWIEHSGWPIDYTDLETYYAPASEILDLGGSSFATDPLAGSNDPVHRIAVNDFRQRLYRFSHPVTRMGKKYQSELEQSDRIAVLLNANLVDLVPDSQQTRIRGATIRTLSGRRGTIQARQFVLACGGIENARILLNTNRLHDQRIGNGTNLVGRFFMEHPHADLVHFVPHDFAWCTAQRALRRDHDHWIGLAVTLTRHALVANKCLNFTGHFFNAECQSSDMMTLGAMISQAPNPESRVMLADKPDALGVPRVRLEWKLCELDWASMCTAARLLGTHFGRLGLGRVRIPDWLQDKNPAAIGYGSHHMGTTRMSANPESGVVDRNCQVHGVNNLYVAGSSIFPTGGAVNPTLTLTALALRLGEYLDTRRH